jgi:tetratricopeptide (TPR) repeat protein
VIIDKTFMQLPPGWILQRDREFGAGAHANLNGIFIDGGQNPRRSQHFESVREKLSRKSQLELYADCECQFGEALFGVRTLLRSLIELLQTQQPSVILKYRPEILAVWPEWSEREFFAGTLPIEMIALGGTKRRLHKDSEQLFRIIHALVSIVLSVAAPSGYAAGGLLLALDNIDAADRLSISFIFHLLHRLRDQPVFVLMSVDRTWYDQPLSSTGPWMWGRCRGKLNEPAVFENAYSLHVDALRLLETAPKICVVSDCARQVSEPFEVPETESFLRYAKFRAFGADSTVAAKLAGVDSVDLENGLSVTLPRTFLHYLRKKVGDAEKGLIIETLIAAYENTVSTEVLREHSLLPLSFLSAHRTNSRSAFLATLASLDVCFTFSLNFEVMLLAAAECREAVRNHPEAVNGHQALSLASGLVHCHANQFEMSLALFESVLASATNPVIKSQACFYSGLLRGKVLGDFSLSVSLLKEGRGYVQDLHTWQAAMEFGWCSNALAFCEWKSGNLTLAEELLLEAVRHITSFEGKQIENLRINLLNNLSVLLEDAGNLEGATSTWLSLSRLSDIIPGGRFSKSFHYRLGWLYLQSRNYAEAQAQYTASYEIAEAYNDLFHMDIITSALAYVSLKNNKAQDGLHWYAVNEAMRRSLGDVAGACSASISISSLQYAAGDFSASQGRLSSIMEEIASLERGRNYEALRSNIQFLESLIATNEKCLLPEDATPLFPKPKRKLTTPFGVIHMMASRDSVSELHRSFTIL